MRGIYTPQLTSRLPGGSRVCLPRLARGAGPAPAALERPGARSHQGDKTRQTDPFPGGRSVRTENARGITKTFFLRRDKSVRQGCRNKAEHTKIYFFSIC